MTSRLYTALVAVCALPALFSCQRRSQGETAASLFWRSDSLQVSEIYSGSGNDYNKVGHHGPAVENEFMGLRLYFNSSGAIDVYSKSGKQMELLKYLWYPSEEQMQAEGAGCDEYYVGRTVGLGGIKLMDRDTVVNIVTTKGRRARVGETEDGHFAEVISYGVPYEDGLVDISLRVEVTGKSRFATVTASEINGRPLRFVTGVNYHPEAQTAFDGSHITVWGVHPANVSQNPIGIGAGMRFNPRDFDSMEKTGDMFRLVSIPTASLTTSIVAASVKEEELDTFEKLEKFISKR